MKSICIKIFVFVLILIFIAAFSSSYSSLNLDNQVFVVAIGIDKSDIENIKVTYEFVSVSSSGDR